MPQFDLKFKLNIQIFESFKYLCKCTESNESMEEGKGKKLTGAQTCPAIQFNLKFESNAPILESFVHSRASPKLIEPLGGGKRTHGRLEHALRSTLI